MNPLKITEPIDSTNAEEFQEEVNRVIKSLSEYYREIVDIKYSTHVFNGCKKGYSAIALQITIKATYNHPLTFYNK